MLWFKGWLETRYRLGLVLIVGMLFFSVVFSAPIPRSAGMLKLIANSAAAETLVMAGMLAGAGIVTQVNLRAERGTHGSTTFTLALPVSRFRLFAVRLVLGWLEMAAGTGLMCAAVWFIFPVLKQSCSGIEMLRFALVLLGCVSGFYFLSVAIAAVLEGMWRSYAIVLLLVGLWWLPNHITIPAFTNLTGAMTDASPLLAHSIPWGTIGFSTGLAAISFVAALKIVQAREY